MNMWTIKINDSVRDRMDAIVARFDRVPSALQAAAKRAGMLFIGRAVKERFTGQGPFPVNQNRLGVRTGLLRRALRASDPAMENGNVVQYMGTNVEYFGPHEFGFRGRVNVKAHTRQLARIAVNRSGRLTQRSRALQVRQFGQFFGERAGSGKRTAQVRAHKRAMNIRARRPLGTAMDQHLDAVYSVEINKALTSLLSRS